MLRSHRILCSCVPALHPRTSICTYPVPFSVFLRRATPSHFHLHDRRSLPFRCFPHARLHARSLFARLLDFRMPARCFPHACLLHTPSLFSAHPFAALPLAVSRTPICCTPARCFPHTRSPHTCSLFPARLFTVSRAPAHRLVLPPLPRASSSASCFLLRLALPSASPRRRSRARRRTQ
jgi:hypothetical protein